MAKIISRGDKGPIVESIQKMIFYLGYRARHMDDDTGKFEYKTLSIDGVFGAHTESAVLSFQSANGLLRDGMVGPSTMQALQEMYSERFMEVSMPNVDATDGMPDRMVFVRAPADRYGEGYDQLSLRNDAASDYHKVYEIVKSKGGVMTSSGAIRSLKSPANRSRSTTSFHYLGLAFDLFIYSGMVDPATDPYVIDRVNPREYVVYARCDKNHAETDKVENAITYVSKKKGTQVEGSFINLTELLKKHGFSSIRARVFFEDSRSIMGAEWWHFQYEKNLTPQFSTFGMELQKVYSEKTLEKTLPWEFRDRIFKLNWF